MKNFILTIVVFITVGCTSKFESQTKFTANPVKSGMDYFNNNLSLSTSTVTFTHIASVNPHVLNGELLQATGFEKQGSNAFIVYNTSGDTIRGGLDIISLANLNAPVLVSSMVSENTEYAEAKIKGNYLYMVGQKKGTLKNNAVLTVVNVSNTSAPVVASELTFNVGYYATSIDIQDSKAYITVPNEGVKVVDISNPLAPSLISTEGASQGNSLFVRRLGTKSLVLGGSSNHNVTAVSGTSTNLYTISSQVQEAPSRFALLSNVLYTNGGNTGLTILDKVNTSSPVLKSATPVAGTGNGIAVDSCKQAYLAQGEQGLLVVDVSNLTNPLQLGIFDFVGDLGSANNVLLMVAGGKQYAFVADGLGGTKIVKINNSSCTYKDSESDEDDENHISGLSCKVYDLQSTQPSSLPNFSLLTPISTIVTEQLNSPSQSYNNSLIPIFPVSLQYLKTWYGVVCDGIWSSIKAEASTISLGSDDGSKLFLDGSLVINNDGLHGPTTVTHSITTQIKDYQVHVEYFQGPASQIQLELQIKGVTTPLQYMNGFSH